MLCRASKSPFNPERADSSHAALDTLDLATTIRAFGAATTSSLPVPELLAELKRALAKEGVRFDVSQMLSLSASIETVTVV